MVGLHLSERLFHFAEDPNCFGHRIRRTIAFEPRDQPSLTLNASALVENIRLADLDWRVGLCDRVGHVIQTPAQSKSSRKPTPATFKRRRYSNCSGGTSASAALRGETRYRASALSQSPRNVLTIIA